MPPKKMLSRHPIGAILPTLCGPAREAMVDDIRAHGKRMPVIMFEGKILDGWNSYVCALEAGKPLTYQHFEGTWKEAIAFVVSLNLTRRHLPPQQASMFAAQYRLMLKAIAEGREPIQGHGLKPDGNSRECVPGPIADVEDPLPVPTQAQTAAATGVSLSSLKRAETVLTRGTPELVSQVASGEVGLRDAAASITAPKKSRKRTVKRRDHAEQNPREFFQFCRSEALAKLSKIVRLFSDLGIYRQHKEALDSLVTAARDAKMRDMQQ